MGNHNIETVLQKSKNYIERCKITKSDDDMISSIKYVLKKTEDHFSDSEIEKTANWILFKDKWLDYESSDRKPNFYNYSRGDIVLSVDFGTTNMGTEIRYPHPCVVLFDNCEDWIVVAPITAAQIDKATGKEIVHPPFEVYVDAQSKPSTDPNEFFFKKKSVIQVDQICRISKYRAINKTKKKLRVDLLNQIDNVILKNYLPKKDELLSVLKQQLTAKEIENKVLMDKIMQLENEKSELVVKLQLHDCKK